MNDVFSVALFTVSMAAIATAVCCPPASPSRGFSPATASPDTRCSGPWCRCP